MLAEMGHKLRYTYNPANRVGDHICYISDLTKLHSHFPNWKLDYDLPRIVSGIIERHVTAASFTKALAARY